MNSHLTRRTFLAGVGAVAAATTLPSFAAAADRAHGIRFGYTAMTWGNDERQAIDDIAAVDGKAVKLGDLAQYVLDKRIPLEICLISNVHTGATPSLGEHPFKILYQEKFRVTLNTDNRLMSSTSMTQEFEAAAETFGLSLDDFEKITINAMKSAFLPYRQRCDFIYSIIKPGYARIRKSVNSSIYSQ